MKTGLEAFSKTTMALLLMALLWSTWQNTARGAVIATNAVASPAEETPLMNQLPYLTFHLDRVEALQRSFLGIPLWQYLASLIEVVHLWNSTDHKAYLRGLQTLNLRVKDEFDKEGIEFAFPTQTIYVKETQMAA